MTFLYKIILHPFEHNHYIQKYEIIRRTPKYYHIALRDVANKEAEKFTSKVHRDKVENPLGAMNEYFFSGRGAWEAFMIREKNAIKQAQATIDHSRWKIVKLKEDIPESSLQLY